MRTGVQPENQAGGIRGNETQPIKPDGHRVIESGSQQRSGKRNEDYTKKHEQIQPQQPAVHLFDEVQRVMMRDPVNADDDEAQYERSQRRNEWPQGTKRKRSPVRNTHVKNQQGDDDGKDAIAE